MHDTPMIYFGRSSNRFHGRPGFEPRERYRNSAVHLAFHENDRISIDLSVINDSKHQVNDVYISLYAVAGVLGEDEAESRAIIENAIAYAVPIKTWKKLAIPPSVDGTAAWHAAGIPWQIEYSYNGSFFVTSVLWLLRDNRPISPNAAFPAVLMPQNIPWIAVHAHKASSDKQSGSIPAM